MMEVKVQVARAVCKRHAEDEVVIPTNMRLSVFTTHDVDNLDSNKTGNLSRGDFHGTLLQQIICQKKILEFVDLQSNSIIMTKQSPSYLITMPLFLL